MKAIKRIFFGGQTLGEKEPETIEYEDFPEITSLDQTIGWSSKHLTLSELEDAKEKLFTVLTKDMKISSSYSKMLVNHVLGVKAMYNAGYAREYIKKLLITNKLVQELYDTKIKLRHINKQYARASNTIFELKAKLAFAWRREVDEGLKSTLNRIEKIQQQLMEKK